MDQVLPYFKEAEKLLQADDFPDGEARDLFIQNVFVELDGKEVRLCCHPDGSRIVESLLRVATNFQLRVFGDRLAGAALKMATNRYASHCLETFIQRAAESEVEEEQEGPPSLSSLLARFLSELSGSGMSECISHPQGSHVLRKLMVACQGTAEHEAAMQELKERFNPSWPYEVASSAFLQAVMTEALAVFLVEHVADKRAMMHKSASHLVECVLQHLPGLQLNEFYRKHLRPRLAELIAHPSSLHIVKTAIKHAHSLPQFKLILDDLTPLATRLPVTLLNACLEHAKQDSSAASAVFKLVCESFGAKSPAEKKQLPRTILTDFSRVDKARAFLLNQLLQLPEESRCLIDGLLEFTSEELVQLACQFTGSLAIQPVFDVHGAASEKARHRLYRKLLGHLVTLSIDKHGSHLVDACWQGSNAELRSIMVAELAAGKTRLMDSPHGRLILRNCRVEEWQRQREGWQEAEERAEKRKTLFADILDEDAGDSKKLEKKKKVKKEKSGLLLNTETTRPQLEL